MTTANDIGPELTEDELDQISGGWAEMGLYFRSDPPKQQWNNGDVVPAMRN
jgi:bacteriocin-like protein